MSELNAQALRAREAVTAATEAACRYVEEGDSEEVRKVFRAARGQMVRELLAVLLLVDGEAR